MFLEKLDEFNKDTVRIIDLEEELIIAKEVSIRLHAELEQAKEWRVKPIFLPQTIAYGAALCLNLRKLSQKRIQDFEEGYSSLIRSKGYNQAVKRTDTKLLYIKFECKTDYQDISDVLAMRNIQLGM